MGDHTKFHNHGTGQGEHVIPETAHYRMGTEGHDCSSCVFFSDGLCEAYDASVQPNMLCDSYEPESALDGDGDQGNGVGMSEMYCSDGGAEENDGLIWKTVLRTGTWRYRPGAGQRPVNSPLTVVKGPTTSRSAISLDQIVESWNKGAIEHVTVPLSHADRTEENTGWVRQLKIEQDPDRAGHYILRAGMEFTEPDIKQKVVNRSIANTSVGLYYDYIRKDDGEKFPIALAHIALTNRPWINGMRPFGMSEEDVEINSLEFAEDMEKETPKTSEPEVPTTEGTFNVPVTFTKNTDGKVHFSFAPRDQWSQENSGDQTPQTQNPKTKENHMSKVPGLEGLDLAEDAAAKVAEILAAAEAERDAAKAEAQSLRDRTAELSQKAREHEVDDRIDELKDMGLSEQAGFLKVVREVLLADDGEQTLQLSEGSESITFSDVVNKLIDALPKKDGKVNFGEQVESVGASTERPAADATGENKSAEDKYAEAYEDLYGTKPEKK